MMKKLAAATMALLLMMACAWAMAEEPKMITYDFGDFTIELEEGIIGNMWEKADGAVRLAVYPNYREGDTVVTALNLIWSSAYTDLKETELEAVSSAAMDAIKAQLAAEGIMRCDLALLASERVKHDGVHGITHTYRLEYAQAGKDAEDDVLSYMKWCFFSDEYLGTYTIMMTAGEMEEIDAMQAIVDTIRWN